MKCSILIFLVLAGMAGAETLTFDMSSDSELVINSTSMNTSLQHQIVVPEGCPQPPALYRLESSYAEYNDGQPFGQSSNTDVLINLQINQMLVLSDFSMQQTNDRRVIVFEQVSPKYNLMEYGTISISTCPGDFTENALCVMQVNNFTNKHFSTNPNDFPGLFCLMEQGQSYFFNVVLSEDALNTPPECNSSSHVTCAMYYTEESF